MLTARKLIQGGYSLVEVLVTVILITILSALLMPVMQSSRDTAKLAVCTSNMKQIYNGLVSQSVKLGKGLMPPSPYKWESYAEALVEQDVMICPLEGGDQFKADEEAFEFLPEPPTSMQQGELESDSKVFVFREQSGFELPVDVDVVNKPGRYGRDYGEGGACRYDPNGVIPKGALVDSFYFSYDPRTDTNNGNEGLISFGANSVVAGFVGENDDLKTTDDIVGVAGVDYPDELGCRRIEGCNSGQYSDSVALTPDGRSIIHHFARATTSCKDDLRVFTTVGGGSSYAMNVEVPNHPSSDLQLFMVDAKIPWIDFTGGDDDNGFTFEQSIDARHFGKVNAMTVQGSVELMEIDKIQPDSIFWRS